MAKRGRPPKIARKEQREEQSVGEIVELSEEEADRIDKQPAPYIPSEMPEPSTKETKIYGREVTEANQPVPPPQAVSVDLTDLREDQIVTLKIHGETIYRKKVSSDKG